MSREFKLNLILSVLIISILPFLYLCFFTNPSADDFGFSHQAMEQGFYKFIYSNYFFLNGRYISNILIYFNPIVFGSFIGYKIAALVILLFFLFSTFLVINEVLRGKSIKLKVILSLCFSLLFIHNMPIISEGIYWYTGSSIYLIGLSSMTIYITLLVKHFRKPRKLTLALSILFLFFSCGFNEVSTLLIIVLLGFATGIHYKNKLQGKKVILYQFLFALLFSSILILSPGNEHRGAEYAESHNLFRSLFYSTLQVGRFFVTWIASAPLIIISILYYHYYMNSSSKNYFESLKNLNRWASLSLLGVVIFVCVFPPYWATNILGQHRTLNVAYFFFLIMWFINLTVWLEYYKEKLRVQINKRWKNILIAGMFVGLFFTGNGLNACVDLFSGEAKNYNKELTIRFQKLRKNNFQEDVIHIPSQKAKPKTLFVSDLSEDPAFWSNQAYKQYFNLKKEAASY